MRIAAWLGARLSRVVGAVCLLGATATLGAGCAAEADDQPATEDDDYTRRGKIQLLVTVDWEGRDLRDANIQAMRDLHTRFPQVKVVHFLNAAYFTKGDSDAEYAKQRIASTIAPGDEKGLHIHGWKRLFEASGVTFKSTPTFWGTSLRPNECIYDCGHEVPISLYSAAELRKVVRFSLDKLDEHGFGGAKSFRCGGWMAKDSVREAVAAEGLVYEQSAVPTAFLQPKLQGTPVLGWLGELWEGTTETSQPYTIETSAGRLTEVPDNGALADYVSADQMVGTFEANKATWLRDRRKNVVVSIGFHHETAAQYLPQLEAALTRMYDIAARERLPLESVTSEAIAVRR
ncbi:MAG: hypothetical protein KF795_30960 [Labilithrix sp.]|nr:hypothetical protein [Labilithrix sp.]